MRNHFDTPRHQLTGLYILICEVNKMTRDHLRRKRIEMVDRSEARSAIEHASDIIVAYLANHSLSPGALVELLRDVRAELEREPGQSRPLAPPLALAGGGSLEADNPAAGAAAPVDQGKPQPAVPIEQSVTPDYIVSLEDGRAFRSLTRHLMAKHGLSPAQYREKWGLPDDYPMVAPNYARERSEVAKRIGLGKSAKKGGAKPSAVRRAPKPA